MTRSAGFIHGREGGGDRCWGTSAAVERSSTDGQGPAIAEQARDPGHGLSGMEIGESRGGG